MSHNFTNILVIIIQWDKIMLSEKWRNPLRKQCLQCEGPSMKMQKEKIIAKSKEVKKR